MKEDQPGRTRERLEHEADAVRSRLLDDLDELKGRGRAATDFVASLKRKAVSHPGAVVGIGLGAVVALGFVWYARRARRRREQRRDAILGLAARLLGPAYVVQSANHRSSFLKNTLKRGAIALVGAAGRELGRRALLAASTPEPSPGDARVPA